ncbi:hypothetical protein J8273_2935 [Carpediemonas membranifera]|uniref:Uncharacterized protein n=1 Tax=Carpediemonas membranifera TaxID=201153 RepID=A0A8J6B8H8_9EUKA|nr:hypothetical protein J8273_2935 [Carpediemonas membranifera]|eukprot:KAG9395369.1 hypothetical protein J8273_2935 [Carpediemonas membranifera]
MPASRVDRFYDRMAEVCGRIGMRVNTAKCMVISAAGSPGAIQRVVNGRAVGIPVGDAHGEARAVDDVFSEMEMATARVVEMVETVGPSAASVALNMIRSCILAMPSAIYRAVSPIRHESRTSRFEQMLSRSVEHILQLRDGLEDKTRRMALDYGDYGLRMPIPSLVWKCAFLGTEHQLHQLLPDRSVHLDEALFTVEGAEEWPRTKDELYEMEAKKPQKQLTKYHRDAWTVQHRPSTPSDFNLDRNAATQALNDSSQRAAPAAGILRCQLMFAKTQMTIPELDAINLDRESVRSFKRQVQRLKVFAPDAKASLFLTDALSDLIQRQFDLNAETITEEELFKHLDKLVGPQTSRQWLAELSKVRCESTITDLNTRTVLVRKYINAFQDIFQLYTKGTFSEEENLSRDDDTVIEKATKLCLSHLAPDAFQRVVRTEYDLRKPTKLEDVYKLTEAARVEDQLRLDMTRYGYDLVRTKKARTKANSDPDTDESSSTKQALPIKAKEAAPTSKPRPNDIHPTNRPPKTPCPICQGNHWRNECPRSEKTRSRESGGGLRAKSELKAKTPFEAMILDDAEIDTEDDVLKTTGHINGQEYVSKNVRYGKLESPTGTKPSAEE